MKRAILIVSSLFLAALLAAPAAWAQWPASSDPSRRDPRARDPRAGDAASRAPQPSINVGTWSGGQIEPQATDAQSRRERRNRRAARQTGIDTSQPSGIEATVHEDSSDLLGDNQIKKTDYNAVASQLMDTSGLIYGELSAMAEDQSLACDGYGGLNDLGFPTLVGDVFVTPPDGLPVFETDSPASTVPADDN